MAKTIPPTPHDRVIDQLRACGARQLATFTGTGNRSAIGMWTTAGGMLLVQSFSGGGVDVYLPATSGLELPPMLDAVPPGKTLLVHLRGGELAPMLDAVRAFATPKPEAPISDQNEVKP